MTQSNKSEEATVTLTAYDRNGEVVDKQTTQGRHAPELIYIDFAYEARAAYKAVRIVMEVAFALILALNLSQSLAEARTHDSRAIIVHAMDPGCHHNNPFCGFRSIDVSLTKEEWYGLYPPVPYYEYWDNNLNQTAQQMVAIASLLQNQEQTAIEMMRQARDKLREQQKYNSRLLEERRTDMFGPKPFESTSSQDTLTAIGLALLCLAGLLFLLSESFYSSHKNYRKFWKQRSRRV